VWAATGLIRTKKIRHFNFWLTRVRHILYNRLEHRDANYTWTNFLRRLPKREKQSYLGHSSNRESLIQRKKVRNYSKSCPCGEKKCALLSDVRRKWSFISLNRYQWQSCLTFSRARSQTVGFLPLNLMKLFLCKEQLTTELAVLYKRQEFSSILGLRKFTWACSILELMAPGQKCSLSSRQ